MSQYYEDLLIDALLDVGFTLDEAVRLIKLQQRSDGERHEQPRQRSGRQWQRWRGNESDHIWN